MSVQGEFYPELDERKTLNIKKLSQKQIFLREHITLKIDD